MNSQKLTVLAIVAAVMVIWAVILSNRSVGPARDNVSANLIQGLDPDLIAKIEVGTDEDKVVLVRQGKQFVAQDKSNYPASSKEINDLLTKCMDIKTTELYSTNSKNHEDLGVTDEKARTVIRFHKADGSLLTGLLVGETRSEGGSGSFVRRADSNDVYVAGNVPYFRTGITSYLEQELTSVDKENIASVAVTSPNDTYVLKTEEEDSETILMENLPAGKKLATSTARSVLTALTSMRFDDVARDADPNATFDRMYVARLKDATVYTLKIAKTDDKTYAQITAEYTDKVMVDPSKQDSDEERAEKAAKLKTQEKALTFKSKHEGWIYEIPDWKGQYLTKALDELLEDLPEPEPAVEPNDVDAAPDPVQEALNTVDETLGQ